MNYYNEPNEMQALLSQHASAKSKMTKGIVLTSIGYFLLYFGICFLAAYLVGIIFIIPSIPLLIIGIINLVKVLKRNNLNKKEGRKYGRVQFASYRGA